MSVDDISTMLFENKVNLFESMLRSTNREGIDKVIDFLRGTDFYYAPASSTYHSNYNGGLLDHSLIVYYIAMEYKKSMVMLKPDLEKDMSDESIAISALLHDVCKTCFYKETLKWRKDVNDNWEQYKGYIIDDTFPIGHGEKSVIMLQNIGLELTPCEMLAIRYHMGFWGTESTDVKYSQTAALKMCPLVLLLQVSDFTASVTLEKEIVLK